MNKLFMFWACLLTVAASQALAGARGAKVQPVAPPEAEPGLASEVVQVYPNFVALGPGDSLGYTVSDYATNRSACHNLVNFGDGTLALGRMMAIISDATDRGTYYSYSSDGGTSWSPLSWIEGGRRGWGNIGYVTSAGTREVTLAHDFPSPLDFCVDAALGANVWSCSENSGGSQVWPRLAAVGRNTIHAVYAEANPPTMLLYARSRDTGQSWDVLDQPVFTLPDFEAQADAYDIAAHGTNVAVVNAPSDNVNSGDVLLALSTNNGNTWSEQIIYEIKEEGELMTGEEQFQPDGAVACVYDSSGVLHVVWTNFLAVGDASNNPVLFYQIDAPLMYWSEATGIVEITPTVHDSSIVKVSNQFGNLVTQPDIGFDTDGNLYIMFQQTIDETDSQGNYVQHIYATGSPDGGTTWTDPQDITPGTGFDASFGSMADLVDDNIHLSYFSDPLAGSAIRGNHDTVQVAVMYHDFDAASLTMAGLSCGDLSSFVARCVGGQTVQARVRASGAWTGTTVTISIDGTPHVVNPQVKPDMTASQWKLQVSGVGPGTHTISLKNPAGCFSDIVVDCGADQPSGWEWEDDASWGTREQNATVDQGETKLLGNYPNPFNPSTTIRYVLAEETNVSVKIYNMLGQEVATLVNGVQRAGEQSVAWYGTNNLGQAVSSGLYIYRIKAGNQIMTEKMIFMK